MTFFATNAGGSNFDVDAITIANGGTTSTAHDLQTNGFVGFITPAALTGSVFTFTGSADGTNFYPLYNSDNTAFSITVGTSRYYCLNPADFLGMRYVKIVSGSAEGADRSIIIITRSFT